MTAVATSTRMKVIVQQAIDEAVYFTDTPVEYESVRVDDRATGDFSRIVFVVFTPTNGHNRGQRHLVPVTRVIAIVEDDG